MKPYRVVILHSVCALLVISLAGCGGGGGGGGSSAPPANDDTGNGSEAPSVETFFAQRVSRSLNNFCLECHIPTGVGNVPEGKDFMFRGRNIPVSQLFDDMKSSWQRLGGNNPVSRILTMASGEETPHSGGAPWRRGTNIYQDVSVLLQCFEQPDRCDDLLAARARRHSMSRSSDHCSAADAAVTLADDYALQVLGHEREGAALMSAARGEFYLALGAGIAATTSRIELRVEATAADQGALVWSADCFESPSSCESENAFSLACSIDTDNVLSCGGASAQGLDLTPYLWGNSTDMQWALQGLDVDGCRQWLAPMTVVIEL